jgi:dTDP-4-amino-4,6-dideoxygalactose transaminase
MIPFADLSANYSEFRHEIDEAVSRTLRGGRFILGEQLQRFEEEFARFIGVDYCAGVATGTDAITLCLQAAGINRGDEVITAAMTAFPTITGILQAGAIPVVVDITDDDGLIDYALIAERITAKTKAIVAVHLYGQCCDMNRLLNLAHEYGLFIVEDAAQAAGATFGHRRAGSFGICNAFSFYPTKNLGAFGDGGAITTNNRLLYESIIRRRNYGQTDRYRHDGPGVNSRLDELQAAVLRVKLHHLPGGNKRRAVIAEKYRANLNTVKCLVEHDYGDSNHHLFVVRHNRRDQCMRQLELRGVQTHIHYPLPVYRQKAFPLRLGEECAQSEAFSKSVFSLPIYPELSDVNVEKIIEVVNDCV